MRVVGYQRSVAGYLDTSGIGVECSNDFRTRGLRGYIAFLALLSAGIAAYEAWLFALLGHIVDWLGHIEPARLWEQQGPMLQILAGVLVASTLLVAMQTIVKHQTLAINFPLRLRWR